jgi:hypothetical protein
LHLAGRTLQVAGCIQSCNLQFGTRRYDSNRGFTCFKALLSVGIYRPSGMILDLIETSFQERLLHNGGFDASQNEEDSAGRKSQCW